MSKSTLAYLQRLDATVLQRLGIDHGDARHYRVQWTDGFSEPTLVRHPRSWYFDNKHPGYLPQGLLTCGRGWATQHLLRGEVIRERAKYRCNRQTRIEAILAA